MPFPIRDGRRFNSVASAIPVDIEIYGPAGKAWLKLRSKDQIHRKNQTATLCGDKLADEVAIRAIVTENFVRVGARHVKIPIGTELHAMWAAQAAATGWYENINECPRDAIVPKNTVPGARTIGILNSLVADVKIAVWTEEKATRAKDRIDRTVGPANKYAHEGAVRAIKPKQVCVRPTAGRIEVAVRSKSKRTRMLKTVHAR